MCFKKKLKTADKVRKDRELIASNAKSIETAIVGIGENKKFIEELKDVQEKLKYLRPSDKTEVIDYDKAINKRIIELNRYVKENSANTDVSVQEYILKINMLMSDRNTIL